MPVDERRFLHFSDAPPLAQPGGTMVTPRHGSRYWNRQHERIRSLDLEHADQNKELQVYASSRAQLLKEIVFEQVRTDLYGNVPSRTRCLFLFDIDVDPDQYAEAHGLGNIADRNLVELEVLTGVLHRVPVELLNCNNKGYGGLLATAHDYWSSNPNAGLDNEILFEGTFRVVKLVRPAKA